jgi:hypothetical protein
VFFFFFFFFFFLFVSLLVFRMDGEEEITSWVGEVLGVEKPSFPKDFKDGTLLCKLANVKRSFD